MRSKAEWTLMAASAQDIEQLRQQCRRLVLRRARWSAALSALPLPGLDLLSDASLLTLMLDDINRNFGLTAEQIDVLHPALKWIAYEAGIGLGAMLVGKVLTREVILALCQRSGVRLLVRQAARLVPLAGQLVSAALGFAVVRQIGYQHVDACAVVAQKLLLARTDW